MIRSRKTKRKMLAITLSLGVFASTFTGLKLYNKTSEAAAGEKIYNETSTKIQWAYTVSDGKATNVYIHAFLGDNSDFLGASITVPPSFTDTPAGSSSSETYPVVSIGSNGSTSIDDSFFDHTVVSHIPTVTSGSFTIDASGISTLTTVNEDVLKGRSNTTLKLPKSITSVASGVLGKTSTTDGKNNAIECDSLNATYSNSGSIDTSTFKFTGFMNSTANDTFGSLLGDDQTDGDHRFIASTDNNSIGSFKYIISYPDGLNCDSHTPTSFANNSTGSFSAYVYKSTDSAYAVFNKLSANALPKTRKHHTFNGYFTAPTAGVKLFNTDASFNTSALSTDLSGITDSSVNLYAQWTPGNITIKYHAIQPTSGNAPADQTVAYGSTATLTANPWSRTGHVFHGWSKESNGVKTYDDGATTEALFDDMDLYTCWTTNSYTIRYNANGGLGNQMSDQTVSYFNRSTAYISENTYQKDGYNFKGWTLAASPAPTDASFTGVSTVDDVLRAHATTLPTSNPAHDDPYINTHATTTDPIVLYAKWEKGKYTINYVDSRNAAAFAHNPEIRECENTAAPETRSDITGYTFLGWSDTENGTVAYPKGQALTRDLAKNGDKKTIYAIYKPHTFKIKYLRSVSTEGTTTVTDGGPDMNDTECTYGSYLSSFRSCAYTRPGCRFVGWKRTTSSSEPPAVILPYSAGSSVASSIDFTAGQGTADIPVTSDNQIIYVYPVWQKERYTLHYQGDGTSGLSDETFEYGDTITLPTLTMRDHTFKGWMESDNTYDTDQLVFSAPARNLTVTARWDNDHFITISPDSYINTITASVNGTQKTLVSNGTLTSMTFKGGEQISNIKITSVNNQLIKAYNITNESGTSLASGTLSTPASTVTVNRTITFPTGSNMNIAITPKAAEFKINFNTNGGIIIGTTPTTYTYGQELLLPTYVVKDGSTFYGWKNSAGTMVSAISKTQTGDQTFTAVWNDPNVTDLPQGAKAVASANGKIVTITYANKTTEDVNIAAQGIALKGGSNSIQFKTSGGKTYLTTVNYIAAVDLPSTIKANYVEGAATATITYADGTTQTIAVNKYNSDTTLYGTRIFFDGIDGKRYTVIPSATADPNPSASPAPSADPGNNQKPRSDEYYMISKVSYNVRNGKASATNPYDWDAKKISVKSKVKIYGKSYKVTKITADAFYGMPNLTTLVISKNVTSVGKNAARDCRKLKTIKIYSKKLFSMGKNWLKNIAKDAYVYIKAPKKQYRKIRDLTRKKSGCPKSTHFRRIQ